MRISYTIALVAALGATGAAAQSKSAAPAPAAPVSPAPSSSSGTTGLKGLRPVASPKVIALDQAFGLAVQQSFDLRIAQARIDEATSQVRKAWALVTPSLSLGAQYTFNYPDQTLALGSVQQNQQQALLFNSLGDITAQSAALNPDPIAQRAALEKAEALHAAAKQIASSKVVSFELQPAHVVDGSLTLAVPLFNGRSMPLLQNAYAGVDLTKLSVRSARAQIIYGVARAYYQVIAGKRIVEIAKKQVDSATKHRDLAKQRLDEGASTPLVVQRAELDLARAEMQAQAAEGGVRVAKGALGSILGVIDDFDVAEPPAVPALELGATPEELLNRALAARDDLRIEKQSLGIADRNKTDAWMRFLPTLQLVAQARATTNTGGLVSDPLTGAIQVQASVPIFDGGMTLGTLDEADAKLRQEILRVRQLELSIEQEVRGTLDDLQLKRTSAETALRVAELARATSENADQLLEAGAATSLDAADASLGAFSADVDAARARLDLETARLGLAFALGELRPSDDLSPNPMSGDDEKGARALLDGVKP